MAKSKFNVGDLVKLTALPTQFKSFDGSLVIIRDTFIADVDAITGVECRLYNTQTESDYMLWVEEYNLLPPPIIPKYKIGDIVAIPLRGKDCFGTITDLRIYPEALRSQASNRYTYIVRLENGASLAMSESELIKIKYETDSNDVETITKWLNTV